MQSSISGIWGEARAGGTWGDELRRTGFDGIVIKGKARNPVYLWIQDGEVKIKDAAHLWGKDTYEVNDLLKQETDAKASVATIGRAGEKLARIACVMNDGKAARAAARCGMGAVMGSKNLKAVVVRGTGLPEIHDRKKLVDKIKEHYVPSKAGDNKPPAAGWRQFFLSGIPPIKNWAQGTFDGFADKTAKWREEGEQYYCRRCRSSCRESKMQAGTRHLVWEAMGPLGPQCLVDHLEAIEKAYELCNRYGLDSMETGGAIAFAMEAYEKGLISRADTGGVDLTWGNHEALVEMTRMIGEREGFGEVLGEGLRIAAERVGGSASEYAGHIKGLAFPAIDPRWSNAVALEYATSSIGAWHFSAVMAGSGPATVFPDLGISGVDHLAVQGMGATVAKMQDFASLFDALTVCKFLITPPATGREDLTQPSHLLEWLNCTTGWDLDLKEFLRCGERNINLQRMINVRRGISRKDDIRLPKIMTLPRQGSNGNLPPLGRLLADYYAYRGWTEEGIPTKQKLTELGLDGLS